MQNNKGSLIVVSGPSGAGKSTVIGQVMNSRDDIKFSVSATTREPRHGEIDGKDYWFVEREKFLDMVESDQFLEYAKYVDNLYGTPIAPISADLEKGYSIILDIEVQGALQVKARMPEAVMVFLMPSDFSQLEKRLRGRNKDDEAKILSRVETAWEEYQKANLYEYIVVNDDAVIAANELDAIITAEKCRTHNRREYLITDNK